MVLRGRSHHPKMLCGSPWWHSECHARSVVQEVSHAVNGPVWEYGTLCVCLGQVQFNL